MKIEDIKWEDYPSLQAIFEGLTGGDERLEELADLLDEAYQDGYGDGHQDGYESALFP